MQDDRLDIDLVTAPAAEPVMTAEAKTHCRVVTTADDAYIDSLIAAARIYLEQRTGRAIVTQTWKYFLDAFPDEEDLIRLPRFPVASVTHVKYYDSNGVQQTWGTSNYQVLTSARPPLVVLAADAEWPTTQDNRFQAVEIQFVAGQAVASVPADVKHLLKCLVAHWYENREPADSLNFSQLPFTVEAMIQNLKARGLR